MLCCELTNSIIYRVGPSLPHHNPLSFLKENNKFSIDYIKVATKVERNRNKNYTMEFKNSNAWCNCCESKSSNSV